MKKINVARDAEDFSSPYKVALIASHDEQGDVHISLLSSLMNRGDDEMVFGEFITGDSKTYIHERPKTGFLIMNLSMNLWTGTLDFYDKKSISGQLVSCDGSTTSFISWDLFIRPFSI